MAIFSDSAALGGMLVPATLFIALTAGEPGQHGWVTVMATDTAFVIGALTLPGKCVPYSPYVFMLSLDVIDDIGSILIIAIGRHSGWHRIHHGTVYCKSRVWPRTSRLGLKPKIARRNLQVSEPLPCRLEPR